MPFSGKDYRLGLDLQGGIELDYKVDLETAQQEEGYNKQKQQEIIEWLKSIIDKRIETLNINDSVITSWSYAWEQHIIVQIPLKGNDTLENNENIQKAKDAIGKVVKIEFRERRDEITQEDIDARKVLAESILKEVKSSNYDFSVTSEKVQLSYENVQVGEVSDLKELFTIDDSQLVEWQIHEITTSYDDSGYLILDIDEETLQDEVVKNYSYIYISKKPSDWKAATDSQGRVLNDKYFVKSSVQQNEAFQPLVELTFNSEGAQIFWELTKRLVGEQIAIFVGGELLTAPNVNEPILNGRAVITGSYTHEEARKLSQDINTWVVPAPIYLTSEKTIDSKLGASSLEKLIVAWVSGFLIIFFFLVVIYRLAGVWASIALFLYIIMVLAIIKVFGVVLTLASIAGLILSIGIAIDANILIFERIKDEIRKGYTLDKATKIGFKKSWTAIWDSNFTGFIVALILFIFGINLIKGFGLMLGLGIIVSLFSAMYISRILLMMSAMVSKNKKYFIWIK